MDTFVTSVHYPDPDNKSVAHVRFRAMQVGNYLVASPTGKTITIELTHQQAREIFDRLTVLSDERQMNGEYPFPPSYRIFANNGVFTVDAEFLSDVCGSLLQIMVENELGSLLDMYIPDGSFTPASAQVTIPY